MKLFMVRIERTRSQMVSERMRGFGRVFEGNCDRRRSLSSCGMLVYSDVTPSEIGRTL